MDLHGPPSFNTRASQALQFRHYVNLCVVRDFSPNVVVLVVVTCDIYDPNVSPTSVSRQITDLVDPLLFVLSVPKMNRSSKRKLTSTTSACSCCANLSVQTTPATKLPLKPSLETAEATQSKGPSRVPTRAKRSHTIQENEKQRYRKTKIQENKANYKK
ncbi:hypothetical protein MAR_006911 [Mya arenaria]|uniref:Uncharacterized protein n=1 Tax=Mya arenaria TaxID=6604 RepID=A0ABY7DCK7_MYAAR|nr:hypothetical protein MAR_006911 [Mya arenaria]